MQQFFKTPHTINCNGQLLDLSQPLVMGIINITPDSFYSKSRIQTVEDVLVRAAKTIEEGAAIIDVGAYSSRPGAAHIDEKTEWNRLEPILNQLRKTFPTQLISVDTFRSEIARRAVTEFEVNMINDISAGELDAEMFDTIARLKVPYIMMHMKGNPQNMQHTPEYDHLMKEVFVYFAQKIEFLNKIGIHDVIIDPGFGFGKTLEHNYEIIAKLDEFKIFELPILVGLSRKSMIYNYLNITADDALNGTTILNMLALTKGANILRVHDVLEAVECVKIFNKTQTFN